MTTGLTSRSPAPVGKASGRNVFCENAQTVSPEDTDSLHLPKGARGAMITDVTPDSPAGKAGVQRGDVVLAYNGRSVASWEELRLQIAETLPETQVKLSISRDGKALTVEASLAKFDEKPDELIEGVDVTPLTEEVRGRLRVPARFDGLLVKAVRGKAGDGVSGVGNGFGL